MAKCHYIADSAILLPSFPMHCVRSDVTGGCALVPGVGSTADGMSLLAITITIS
ncbi:hypothetical protein [Bradyrhizobium sp. DASA03007]|uniref:hypothetical protein n=1 Tax=unclassified Bradyrhizobium TaxID=2631580 RepID=UPI003F72F687